MLTIGNIAGNRPSNMSQNLQSKLANQGEFLGFVTERKSMPFERESNFAVRNSEVLSNNFRSARDRNNNLGSGHQLSQKALGSFARGERCNSEKNIGFDSHPDLNAN